MGAAMNEEKTPRRGNTNLPEICILLAAERSGTHYLRSMLEKIPSVVAPGEVCNTASGDIRTSSTSFLRFRANAAIADQKFFYPTLEIQTELVDNYLQYVRASHLNKRYVVLDIKYSHIHNFNSFWWDIVSPPFLLNYAIRKRLRVIHLLRYKPFRTVISGIYARKSGVWRTTNKQYIPSMKITIDRAKLESRTFQLIKTIGFYTEWLKNSRHATISYEKLVSETETTLAELRDFLGLTRDIPPGSEFVRTTPPYEQSIENFAEISDLVDIDLNAAREKYLTPGIGISNV